ncbi:hypothetical protein [Acidicapsa ligni]|uniref:hypothetical protein n=1 Tax=Acidicapsa ligni TaxID=542300 RepID=UPI0021E09D65|nr:hypothetical protein [Acidicapsa ligni]
MLRSIHVVRMNRKGLVPVAFLAVLLLFVAGAGAASRPSAAELTAITERGRLLAGYDAAAWQATDAVLATHPKEGSSNRYIAHKTETGWVVDFGRLSVTEDKFLVVSEAIQSGGQYTVKSFDPAREDTGWNLAAARGIEMAMRDFHGADRPYNVAVLPADGGSLYVYLYPAQVKEGVYPLGADVRYRISPDGTKITEKRQMHKSIIESVSADPKVKVETGYHTHVLSDLPEDTDVFLVLTRLPHVPEIVVTQHYMYTIATDCTITVSDRPK